ncbi:MAG TPA: prepilin-type N-terminal cleavage/methylation domain-containing protein [Actinomycetota bacterium]
MRWRRRSQDQQGLTLVEVMVATSILAVALLIFLSTFASIQRATSRESDRGRNNDEARLAVEELDREIRSGNVLYDPAKENAPSEQGGIASCSGCAPSYTLRVYTQSNAPTRAGFVCRLWRITDARELQTQYWPPLHPEQASSWRTVATGVMNRQLAVPAFTRSADLSKANRTVEILLLVNNDYDNDPGDTVRIQVSLTGRNTLFGYPEDVCDQVPTS